MHANRHDQNLRHKHTVCCVAIFAFVEQKTFFFYDYLVSCCCCALFAVCCPYKCILFVYLFTTYTFMLIYFVLCLLTQYLLVPDDAMQLRTKNMPSIPFFIFTLFENIHSYISYFY